MINYLSPLHAVDLEAWNVPFHETASWIAMCESPHKFFSQAPIQAFNSSLESSF